MQGRNRNGRRTQGFTLIEVLLVLVILGMIAGVLVVAIMPARDKAKIDSTRLLLETVESALDRYEMNIGHYPTEEEGGLNALLTKPTFEDEKVGQNWAGPYLKREPRDAWNTVLHYELNSSAEAGQKRIKLWSNGPDGQDGTEDDIKNWSDEAAS